MERPKLFELEALESLERRAPPGEIERLISFRSDRRGSKGKENMWEVLSTIILHPLLGGGTLGEHFSEIHGDKIAESSLSERRRNIPWQIFREVMEWLLKPLADAKRHKGCFYGGYRLVGLDGTGFSLRNSRSILNRCNKVVSRRLKAAFAKTTVSVLVELGMHNPVGAEIATEQESEWTLSTKVLEQLPEKSLLLAPRLYGVPKFVQTLLPHCERTGSTFLLRVRSDIKSHVIRRLPDGSRVVRIEIRRSARHQLEWSAEVREIVATVQRRGKKAITLRLWTNLFNDTDSVQLAQLYAARWEHELYFRELKHGATNGDLLNSQTPETSCQEIAALLLATSVVAESRIELADTGGVSEVTAVGFERALFHTQFIFYFKMADEDILTAEQRRLFAQKFRLLLAPDKVPKKRSRSCPRAVRQPVKGWPRLIKNENEYGQFSISVKK